MHCGPKELPVLALGPLTRIIVSPFGFSTRGVEGPKPKTLGGSRGGIKDEVRNKVWR